MLKNGVGSRNKRRIHSRQDGRALHRRLLGIEARCYGLTRSIALEVGTTGITVNAICPGYVDTEMVSRGVEQITTKTGRTAEEALDSLRKMSPQNRLVTPEEVAAVALLLASDEGRGINGQGINVDGGSVLF